MISYQLGLFWNWSSFSQKCRMLKYKEVQQVFCEYVDGFSMLYVQSHQDLWNIDNVFPFQLFSLTYPVTGFWHFDRIIWFQSLIPGDKTAVFLPNFCIMLWHCFVLLLRLWWLSLIHFVSITRKRHCISNLFA